MISHPGGKTALAHSGGGYFTRDRHRTPQLEISLHDFGLEESYGRLISEKAYAVEHADVRGSLVDIYV